MGHTFGAVVAVGEVAPVAVVAVVAIGFVARRRRRIEVDRTVAVASAEPGGNMRVPFVADRTVCGAERVVFLFQSPPLWVQKHFALFLFAVVMAVVAAGTALVGVRNIVEAGTAEDDHSSAAVQRRPCNSLYKLFRVQASWIQFVFL